MEGKTSQNICETCKVPDCEDKDKVLVCSENENVKAYYDLRDYVKKEDERKKIRSKSRQKAFRLLKSIKKRKERLEATKKEFRKLFYDEKVFPYSDYRELRYKLDVDDILRD